MAVIRAFRGLRPIPELAEKIAALPYDVMDTEEARAIINENPLSFLKVTKSEAVLPDDVDHYAPEVYLKAKENLDEYIAKGEMKQDEKPCLYIYRQQMGVHIQIGLVAAVSVQEYRDGIIKKHELTRTDKENDRVQHIMTTEAQTGAVFLTYKSKGDVNTFVINLMSNREPVYSFTSSDKVSHTLYKVDAALEISTLEKMFAEIPYLYIADGHHRSAAAARVAEKLNDSGESAYFMAVIFPDNMMQIMDYNRLVKDLNGYTNEEFIEKLGENFEIEASEKVCKPDSRHQFGMYLAGQWYLLTAKADSLDESNPLEALDVAVLQNNVLTPLLNINDPRTDKRIDFVGGIRGIKVLADRVDSGEFAVAFAMYPTSMAELMKVADANEIMPPKSTWFEPKLRDAMVIHMIGDDK